MTELKVLNTQPIEKRVRRDDGTIELHGDPFLTIQGEGPYQGHPAVFVRLAGCNLQCPLCDTDYTSNRVLHTPTAIHLKVEELSRLDNRSKKRNPTRLVVVTGGEPFRQALGPLLTLLVKEGYTVQIETNGTIFDPTVPDAVWDRVTIVCSPKGPVKDRLMDKIDAWKYVIRDGEVDDKDGLPLSVLGSRVRPERPPLREIDAGTVYVQPADEGGDQDVYHRNLEAAKRSVMTFGYVLGVQLHKVIGVV